MKKMNKKGFTIVELVIVIAVIAVLAAVMIPTFSGMIDKANESNALSAAKNAHTSILYSVGDLNDKDATTVDAYIVVDGKYYFEVNGGQLGELMDTEPEGVVFATNAGTNEADWEPRSDIEDLGKDVVVYKYTTENTDT